MSGAEHYDEAERLLHLAQEWVEGSPQRGVVLAEAQVHATLALAAATAAGAL